jgi:hypothetical protein
MWKGTTPSLNATPATTNTSPNTRKLWSVEDEARPRTTFATSGMESVPVAP